LTPQSKRLGLIGKRKLWAESPREQRTQKQTPTPKQQDPTETQKENSYVLKSFDSGFSSRVEAVLKRKINTYKMVLVVVCYNLC
jgi:hypothetical protein